MFAEYAKHGWQLTPIEPGQKRPTRSGWNLPQNVVTHPLAAAQLKAAGLVHALSGTCAIDIDNLEVARVWLMERGIDIDELLGADDAVQIRSPRANSGKLLYNLPLPLRTIQVADYKVGEKTKKALEFRCATNDGLSVQDVLPPSPHPDASGVIDGPYEWAGHGDWRELPDIPNELFTIWSQLSATTTEFESKPTVPRESLDGLLKGLDADMGYAEWLKVGMALHHEFGGSEAGFQKWCEWSALGAKFKSVQDCRSHWQSFSPGGGITGQSLVGMQGMTADDFPVLPVVEAPATAPRVALWTANELLAAHDSPPYLVDGLIEHGAECSLIGPSKSYKSLWALELGIRVATGTPFFGRECAQGLVMYLCGEGAGGIRHRLQALSFARMLDFRSSPFVVLPRPLALPTAEGVQTVKNYIAEAEKEFDDKLALLIIDTYGRFSSGEENVAEDLYKFFRAASVCRAGASLLVVHHTGHSDATRGRGTSAWEQAVDTEFVASIKDDTDTRVFENTKQKDGEPSAPQFFKLARQKTNSTRVGRPVTSVVLEPTVIEAPSAKLGPNEQIVLDTVIELGGGSQDKIVDAAIAKIPKTDGRDKRREYIRRALVGLISKKMIEQRGNDIFKTGDVTADFADLLGAPNESSE